MAAAQNVRGHPMTRPQVASLTNRAWLGYLVVAGIGTAAYPFLPGGPTRAILYAGFGALAAVAILVGIRLHRPAARAGWWLMLASQVAAAIGDVFWVAGTGDAPHPTPVVSAADPFYVAEFVFLALAGVVWIGRGVREQPARLLDVTIAAIGFGTLVWAFSVGPYLGRPLTTPESAATVVSYAIIASLIVGIYSRVAISAGSQTPAAVLILAALVCQAVAYGMYSNAATYQLGASTDLGWMAFAVLRAAAALHPSMARLGVRTETQDAGLPRVAVGFVAVALVTPLVVALASDASHRQETLTVVAVTTTVLALAVFVRTLGLLRDVRAQAARLQVIEAELRDLNALLEVKVAERTAELGASNARLHEAIDRAVASDSVKNTFLSRVSHELRTPLSAVLGFQQLLELEDLPTRSRESVEQIGRAGHHLLDVVNNLIDISRVGASELAFSNERVELGPSIAVALDIVRPLADRMDVHLAADPPEGLAVLADLQRLDQVLLNLCSNAVKNNVRGGRVDVSCRRVADGRIEIAVSDTGIGIPTEMLRRIFEPFERLGTEQSAGVGGTGLGLALSKALVEGMGGTIAAESTVERGSTFRVVFRAADDPTAAA
jgi:signal transduction histidine kinase